VQGESPLEVVVYVATEGDNPIPSGQWYSELQNGYGDIGAVGRYLNGKKPVPTRLSIYAPTAVNPYFEATVYVHHNLRRDTVKADVDIALQSLFNQITNDFGDGIPHAIIPWINNSNYADTMEFMKLTDAQVVFGHFEIAGCLMDRGNMNEHGMKISDFKRFDRVMSGHFHHKSTTQNIDYLGCPYELTWSDYQDPKGFHIYDTETRELEFIQNPYTMFNKVFYNDEGKTLEQILDVDMSMYEGTYVKVVKHSNGNPYWFDKFMDKLIKVEPINVQVVEDHLNLDLDEDDDIVNEAEDTLTILSKYIETMPDNVPKKQLDNLMRSLYTEALHFEV